MAGALTIEQMDTTKAELIAAFRAPKKTKTSAEAWHLQDMQTDKPFGWVQWKGTNVCMDMHCACGYMSHIDADFALHVKCPKCKRIYFCNGHIEMIELEIEPQYCVVMDENPIDDEDAA